MEEPNRSGGGNVRVVQEIDSLAAIGSRGAGSEGERRAARQLQQRLRDLGRDAELEPIRVRPMVELAHAIHALAGIIASVLAVYAPAVGLALAAFATVSAFGELTGTFRLVGALLPARASQNVVSDQDTGRPGLIILVAHYDAPRTGMLNGRRAAAIWPRALLVSLVLITLCSVGRLFGLEATWFTVIQFLPTVVLIALVPALVDAAIADTSEGECDNAAGVAAALRLTSTRLEHFDLMVLLTGASAGYGLGMRQWLKQHRKTLEPSATAVVVLDDLAGSTPAYVEKEGLVFASRMHPTLTALAADLAAPVVSHDLSDAYLSRSAGLPTIRLTAPADERDPDIVTRVCDLAADLLERIDDEIGPELA
ncbi:MAG: hypothetical protein QOJ29_1041 [Thermoleophilaceae bacterium]|nr:hypothetical protein [Thermoleophilaceae bacterium]